MSPEWPAHAAYVWSRTGLLQQIQQLLQAARGWPDVVFQPDYRGLQFLAGDQALGHLRWDGRLAVPFPAELGERLVAEGMAARDPDDRRRDRVLWIVRSRMDLDRAIWLLRLAYLLTNEDRQGQVFPTTFGGERESCA